eukprot:evm.model.scf_1408EXC.6 EVM.evm.TU.scf_1408EXC.6   scf_1408EXC:26080-31058(-)
MPRKRGAARTANHPVLRRLYGDVCDLAEAVVRLVEGTGAKAEMRERLEAAGGSPKLQALLRGTRVAFPGGDPAGPRVRVPDSLSQEQIVQQAARQADNSDVLRKGHKGHRRDKTRPKSMHSINCCVDILTGKEWGLLLGKIGPSVMTHLIQGCSIFVTLHKGHLLQVTGPAITEVAQHQQRAAGKDPPQIALRPGPVAHGFDPPLRSTEGVSPNHMQPCNLLGASMVAPCNLSGGSENAKECVLQGTANTPRKRPSSWRRVRRTVPQPEFDRSRGMSVGRQPPASSAGELQLCLSSCSSESMDLSRSGDGGDASGAEVSRPLAGGLSKGGVAPSRRRDRDSLLGVAHATLPRQAIFYDESLHHCPCLPRKHVLNALKNNKDRGRILYSTIFPSSFDNWKKTVRGSHYRKTASGVPASPARVKKQHRHLPRLLQQLADRAQNCPLGLLLRHHCPDPIAMGVGSAVRDLTDAWTPHSSVISYLWVVLRRIVPPTLLGQKHSRRVLLKALRHFVCLTHHERMSVQQVMHGLKTSDMPWLPVGTGECSVVNDAWSPDCIIVLMAG